MAKILVQSETTPEIAITLTDHGNGADGDWRGTCTQCGYAVRVAYGFEMEDAVTEAMSHINRHNGEE